jgi:hypothetical protein
LGWQWYRRDGTRRGEAFQELRIAEVEGVGPGVEVRRGAGANGYWRMSWQPGKQDILVVRLVSI